MVSVLAFAIPAAAQDTPDDIKRILLDASFGPAAGLPEAYDRTLVDQPTDGVTVRRDIAYGSHPLQQLDVYRPDGVTNAPVVLFVHGGGYTGGSRNESPERWANIMRYFGSHGMVGVNADYRLAPEYPWPAGGEDVRDMVRWIKGHIAEYGGDPERIFAIGFSGIGLSISIEDMKKAGGKAFTIGMVAALVKMVLGLGVILLIGAQWLRVTGGN